MAKERLIAVRMTGLEVARLDALREPNETRSSALRRLINEKYIEQARVTNSARATTKEQ